MSPQKIKKSIDRHFKTDIAKRKRTSKYLFYRDLYFELAIMYCYPKFSYQKIGKAVDRDHATVIHFIKKEIRYPKHKEKIQHFIRLFGDPKDDINANNQMPEILKLKKELEKYKNTDIEKLKKEYEALKQRHENLKKQKSDFVNRLNEFPEEVQESIKARFSLILDAESKKIYSYKEKRRNELKTA